MVINLTFLINEFCDDQEICTNNLGHEESFILLGYKIRHCHKFYEE